MTTWRESIQHARKEVGDTTPIACVVPSEDVLDVEFYDGYGCEQGPEFTLWTRTHVYFPVVYDGSEWAGCAPRNFPAEPMKHQGGG